MQNKKIQAVVLSFLVLSAGAFAEKRYAKPGKSDVVIVAGVSIFPLPNDAFFQRYSSLGKAFMMLGTSSVEKSYIELEYMDTKKFVYSLRLESCEDIFSEKINLPEDRTISLRDFQYHFSGTPLLFFFYLPVEADLVIPEGAKYVYIGSFAYKTAGFKYDVTGVEVHDEYDIAQKRIKERYGDDADLVRVPLRAQREETGE